MSLSEFSLAVGTVWNPGERLIWQGRDFAEDGIKKAPGSFEYTFDMEAHQYILRVQAEGYLPEDTEPFSPDGSPRAFTFRLTRATPIRGTVVNPDGSPARDGFVCLSYAGNELQLSNGDLPEGDRRRAVHAKIAPDGRFSLPPQKDTFLLVALTDTGFAVVRGRDLAAGESIRLQPWARVSGTVKIDGKPAADLELFADPDPPLPVEGEPTLNHRFSFKTDANGRFELPRLMPGHHEIGRWVPNGVPGRIWFITLATLEAESGRDYDLKIGESGRRVTGRLVLPTADVWMIRKAAIESRASGDRARSVGVQIDEDGRFRAGDLSAGDYTLRVSIHEPPPDNACGWGRLVGDYSREFTVTGGDADDDPLDLGALEPAEVDGRPLRVGDVAPDFTVKTLDGKNLTLANFQGKFVLLDFWATWCAPCVAELPNLKAIHEAYRDDRAFVIISLSLDERADVLSRFVKDDELPWLQGIVGPESPVVTAYGATAIPATFLIDPDGRILARDLRGKQAEEAVAKALGR
jgi:peroxiredoxin